MKTANSLPRSIAIAGAWGYIGRKFLDVALARGLETFVYDPGEAPGDIDLGRLIRVENEREFYALSPELFHLALHPEHRRLDWLLRREEPLVILNEKPMAQPDRPEVCREVVEAASASPAVLFYDFPELFDPLTARIMEFLKGFREVRLEECRVQRSKDREDPANPRNYKRMVPIQYQESVHCLAFLLYVLGAVKGGLREAIGEGLSVRGESEAYVPPNPEAYPRVVDGRCRFEMRIGECQVEGLTDFKRGAEWAKRRVIRGTGDGRPFQIDASYLEGEKHLRIDGVDEGWDAKANSYESVLVTAMSWARGVSSEELRSGLYPNAGLARAGYQLSSLLWRSSRERKALAVGSLEELLGWDAGYA